MSKFKKGDAVIVTLRGTVDTVSHMFGFTWILLEPSGDLILGKYTHLINDDCIMVINDNCIELEEGESHAETAETNGE